MKGPLTRAVLFSLLTLSAASPENPVKRKAATKNDSSNVGKTLKPDHADSAGQQLYNNAECYDSQLNPWTQEKGSEEWIQINQTEVDFNCEFHDLRDRESCHTKVASRVSRAFSLLITLNSKLEPRPEQLERQIRTYKLVLRHLRCLLQRQLWHPNSSPRRNQLLSLPECNQPYHPRHVFPNRPNVKIRRKIQPKGLRQKSVLLPLRTRGTRKLRMWFHAQEIIHQFRIQQFRTRHEPSLDHGREEIRRWIRYLWEDLDDGCELQ